jgi:uncharacterized protein YjbI with pentapeptide repeats
VVAAVDGRVGELYPLRLDSEKSPEANLYQQPQGKWGNDMGVGWLKFLILVVLASLSVAAIVVPVQAQEAEGKQAETCSLPKGWDPAEDLRILAELAERRKRVNRLRDSYSISVELAESGRANLCNANLRGADLDEAYLTKADLRGADLTEANLRGAILSMANLHEAKLGSANLAGAYLFATTLTEANLRRTNLHEAKLESANLAGADLIAATLTGADLRRTNLHEAKLESANLAGADLTKANLTNADLTEANLARANLVAATLTEADLTKADLRGADLTKANLTNADLTEANLAGANLVAATLTEADLRRTNLRGADLTEANLTKADLTKANLTKTHLSSTNLTNTVYAPTSPPPDAHVADIQGLQNVAFPKGQETGLVQLRDLLHKAGLRDLERQATYTIESGRTRHAVVDGNLVEALEGIFRFIAFDLTTGYGLHPGRALGIIVLVGIVLIWVYVWAICLPPKRPNPVSGIYRIWPTDRIEVSWNQAKLANPAKVERLYRDGYTHGWSALGYAAYFSLLSAFHIGWRDLNVGTWIARIQFREYTLRATGWVRVVSGIQSLLSVYLLAIWALTYFGRPFQ